MVSHLKTNCQTATVGRPLDEGKASDERFNANSTRVQMDRSVWTYAVHNPFINRSMA